MDSPAVFSSRAWIFTGTGHSAACKTDFGAFELCPSLCRLGPVPAHGMPLRTYRDAIAAYSEIILVYGRASPVGIEVNERDDAMSAAVFIIRHGIMGGVQKELFDCSFREELLQGEPVVKEADGVMPGGRAKEREDGEVVFRIRGREHL